MEGVCPGCMTTEVSRLSSLLRTKVTEVENKMYAVLSADAERPRARYHATKAHSGPVNPAIRKYLHPTNEELRAKNDAETDQEKDSKMIDRNLRVDEASKIWNKAHKELMKLELELNKRFYKIEASFVEGLNRRNRAEIDYRDATRKGIKSLVRLDDAGIPFEDAAPNWNGNETGGFVNEEDDDEGNTEGGVSVVTTGLQGLTVTEHGVFDFHDGGNLPMEVQMGGANYVPPPPGMTANGGVGVEAGTAGPTTATATTMETAPETPPTTPPPTAPANSPATPPATPPATTGEDGEEELVGGSETDPEEVGFSSDASIDEDHFGFAD